MAGEQHFVPDVIIGGAPRSGTTFLCEALSKHPDVFIPRPFAPEPKVCLTAHPDGAAGLLSRYRNFYGSAPREAVWVEKTTNYFEDDDARRRIAALLPDVKLIFLLREPVERAYSNWRWSRKNGLETLSFEQAIRLEGKRPSPFPPERAHVRPFDYVSRGRYGSLAESWIEDFGRDRIAFYLFEQARDAPEKFILDVQRFIGVAPLPWEKLLTGKINATEPDSAGLESDLRLSLRERLAPEVRRFAEVTGLDVSPWGYM